MSEGERLRRSILQREFPTSRLTAELRSSATSYARRRASEGAPQSAIAEELGVSVVSVGRWLRDEAGADFLSVRVVPDAFEARRQFEVVTPRGLRVVGLDIDALCALLERLG